MARERFLAGRKAEAWYRAQLKRIAAQVDGIVRGMAPDGVVADVGALVKTLNGYADLLRPWAESVVTQMVSNVSRRDLAAWEKHGREIGQALRKEVLSAPTGAAYREALSQQVDAITLLPRRAAQRLFELSHEGMMSGERAREMVPEIMATGHVTMAQAKMLARTGVSSTATALTQARAEYIGSQGYFWRTSKDGAVRPSHRKMEGVWVRWDSPPTLDGYTAHCGQFANCRCFCEVSIPDR